MKILAGLIAIAVIYIALLLRILKIMRDRSGE
jgi:hypothetical protein